jgi:hypothetical protein
MRIAGTDSFHLRAAIPARVLFENELQVSRRVLFRIKVVIPYNNNTNNTSSSNNSNSSNNNSNSNSNCSSNNNSSSSSKGLAEPDLRYGRIVDQLITA